MSGVFDFLLILAWIAMASVSARPISNIGRNVQRRLLGNAQRQLAYDDHSDNFLLDYSLSLLHCNGKEIVKDSYGNNQYGVVILRACPKSSCSSSKHVGCTSGYSDFAVPLADFVEAYLDDDDYLYEAESTAWDDQVDASNFFQCTAYNQTWDDDQAVNNYYYVGPSCTSDGKDIQLRLFKDAYCSQPVPTSGSKNGASTITLPFSEDGWIQKTCLSCAEASDDDGGSYNVKDMCSNLYTAESTVRCEDQWNVRHYYWDASIQVNRYGKDTSGCQKITSLLDDSSPLKKWEMSFLIVFGMLVGCCFYAAVWKCCRRKQNSEPRGDEEMANGETREGVRFFLWGTIRELFPPRPRSQKSRRAAAQPKSKNKKKKKDKRSSRRDSGGLGINRSFSTRSTTSLVSAEGGS